MKAYFKKYILNFKVPGGTSRGILRTKETWFLRIDDGDRFGIGECNLFKGLSCDDVEQYERVLEDTCNRIDLGLDSLYGGLSNFPSIQFGIEQAFMSLKAKNPFILFPSNFTRSEDRIKINGLIWMGHIDYMRQQIEAKIKSGFDCIKLKIGALNFEEECELLSEIRKSYPSTKIEIRVDANGAFLVKEAQKKLDKLAIYEIHSIEQPIKPGNIEQMKKLCKSSPIPIALDEELIGIRSGIKKRELLETIKPQFIILKPSLIGGYRGAEEWINLTKEQEIGWWVTSALESNIGLNAIAQWTYNLKSPLPQGLGTGQLFTNNLSSPLEIKEGHLVYSENEKWDLNKIEVCI